MSEAIQIAGALAILVAYALAQFGVIDQRSYSYLIPNLLGAVVLGVIAWVEDLWGSSSSSSPGRSSPPGDSSRAVARRLK
jgi:UDP-N-acetylmuramyl pentapeptide phosphotransferase/UDP-N-acetylglucosamine-1-phosphate transferase